MKRPTLDIPIDHRRTIRDWLETLAVKYWQEAHDLEDEEEGDIDVVETLEAQGNALQAAADLLVPEDEEVRS